MAIDRTFLNAWVDDSGSGLDGTVWNKARINEMLNAIDASFGKTDLLHTTVCKVARTTALSWASGVWGNVVFEVAEIDPQNMHSNGDFYVYLPAAGVYGVAATCVWPAGTGARYLQIYLNGVAAQNPQQPTVRADATYNCTSQVTTLVQANAPNTTVSMQMYQDSGSTITIPAGQVSLSVWRIN